ncbi:MAG: ribosome-associated translation inhibitor RaiA [Deltaproteobacteria bacterium]|nr:ribosome-associated translation inhibitor RaiA [Deltaproteobacteria bacterium]
MKVSVTFRNTDGEEWQKEYIEERLKKLKKYIDNPVDARVVLSVEKFRNVAEVNIIATGLNVNGKEEDKDMHLAIDNAIEKIERQIKKHKEKIRGHKANNSSRMDDAGSMDSSGDEMEDPVYAKLAETKKMVLEPMSIDDAVMEMESSKNRFIIYRDSATENVSLIYRRDDGKYSLIETNG